jgi:AAHS family 4-hydroxybenzoate transporter-like MFS transporter
MRTSLKHSVPNANEKIIKALTANDFLVWSGSQLIAVIFVLFALEHIEGISTTQVGISSMLYLGASALANIPFGRIMDNVKGYVDETKFLVLASLGRGVFLILLAMSTQAWQLYLYQFLLGVMRALDVTAWRTLFSSYMDNEHAGEVWGKYDTSVAIGFAIAAAAGGYLGDMISYAYILIIGGVMSIIASVIPLFILKDVRRSK